jgi:hypothetical protein
MDIRSSGAILKILNIIAMADGYLSPNEELLLQSLEKQYKLQAKLVAWEDELEDRQSIASLAKLIATDYHMLAMRTAVMVASVCRGSDDDESICPAEEQLIDELANALSLHPDDVELARQAAAKELNKQPSLWQVLYDCFGSQFDRPLLI